MPVEGSPSFPVLKILEGSDLDDRGCMPRVLAHPGPQTFRIVDTDNFGSDYPDERFVGPPLTKAAAEKIAKILNDESQPNAPRFHKVVPAGYELQPGFEP